MSAGPMTPSSSTSPRSAWSSPHDRLAAMVAEVQEHRLQQLARLRAFTAAADRDVPVSPPSRPSMIRSTLPPPEPMRTPDDPPWARRARR